MGTKSLYLPYFEAEKSIQCQKKCVYRIKVTSSRSRKGILKVFFIKICILHDLLPLLHCSISILCLFNHLDVTRHLMPLHCFLILNRWLSKALNRCQNAIIKLWHFPCLYKIWIEKVCKFVNFLLRDNSEEVSPIALKFSNVYLYIIFR